MLHLLSRSHLVVAQATRCDSAVMTSRYRSFPQFFLAQRKQRSLASPCPIAMGVIATGLLSGIADRKADLASDSSALRSRTAGGWGCRGGLPARRYAATAAPIMVAYGATTMRPVM